ncbi:MAG: ECF transporter S component [Oscillospiraceae bacterium]|nr:ECF transporter S component [Oscillospiraceae bacterium]
MNKMSHVKRLCICAVCIALCYVLPIAFHSVGLGSVLSPMHIPVLLCGLLCGGGYGFLCGLVGPVLSSLVGTMPPLAMLPRMIPELCAYGLAAGLAMQLIHTRKAAADVYISLVIAMVFGRIIGGVASAIYFTVTTGSYSLLLWATSYFAESLPGIAAHLVLVPVLVLTLQKARVVPARYPKEAKKEEEIHE